MSFREGMKPADVIYQYDGGIAGFFCCVFAAVYGRELPHNIIPAADAQPTLYAERTIETEYAKAARVRESIPKKISLRALQLVENVFLCALDKKEMRLLRFLLHGYTVGATAVDMMGHDDVAPLLAAEKHLMGEAHLLKGFVRFSDYDGVFGATISPKNFVLPLIAQHFVERYNTERFMIYDRIHRCALVYEGKRPQILPMAEVRFPEVSEEEQGYRDLWRRFYKTISIEARENHRCRRTHMPMRYWENMLEVADLL